MSAVRLSLACVPHMREQALGSDHEHLLARRPRARPVLRRRTPRPRRRSSTSRRTCANAFSGDGVLTNCVVPGLIRSEAVDEAAARSATATGKTVDEVFAATLAQATDPRRPPRASRPTSPALVALLVVRAGLVDHRQLLHRRRRHRARRPVGPAMDFAFTPEEEAFRVELRAFLDEELPEWWRGMFVDDERGDPRDPPDLRAGSRRGAGSRWRGRPSSAARAPARGCRPIVREEMWAHEEPRGPQYMNLNYIGPLIMRFGTPEQQQRFLATHGARRGDLVPGLLRARRRAPTSPSLAHARPTTAATTSSSTARRSGRATPTPPPTGACCSSRTDPRPHASTAASRCCSST